MDNKTNINKSEQSPFTLFKEWYEEAKITEFNDPDAMCLATATKDGKPSARIILFKDADERGFKFHTNADSQKGIELNENPYAALCIHWKSLHKQIRVEGIVEHIPDAESDTYFKTRPKERQIGAWASQQSRPLKNRETLETAIADLNKKYAGQDIPRPPNWKGYLIVPQKIEFWSSNPHRLHDRFVFTKNDDGSWKKPQRLYP